MHPSNNPEWNFVQGTNPHGAGTRPPFVPLKDIPIYRPGWTVPALRDLFFKAFDRHNSRGELIKGNGSGRDGVWIQIGRKIMVDMQAFDAWVASHRLSA